MCLFHLRRTALWYSGFRVTENTDTQPYSDKAWQLQVYIVWFSRMHVASSTYNATSGTLIPRSYHSSSSFYVYAGSLCVSIFVSFWHSSRTKYVQIVGLSTYLPWLYPTDLLKVTPRFDQHLLVHFLPLTSIHSQLLVLPFGTPISHVCNSSTWLSFTLNCKLYLFQSVYSS